MRNKKFFLPLLLIVPIASVAIGTFVAQSLWKKSTVISKQETTKVFEVRFYVTSDVQGAYDFCYQNLEYTSAFELPMDIDDYDDYHFLGWTKNKNTNPIVVIEGAYHVYSDLADNNTKSYLDLYAVFN